MRDKAIAAGLLPIWGKERDANLKIYNPLPLPVKRAFWNTFLTKGMAKTELNVLRMIHILRTGFMNSPDGQYVKIATMQEYMKKFIADEMKKVKK